MGLQFVPGLEGMALSVDARHGDEPAGAAAVCVLFVVAHPQIDRAASKAAYVRVAI